MLLRCRAPSGPALALAISISIIILALLVEAQPLLHLWYQRLLLALALEHSSPLAAPWFVKVNRPPHSARPFGSFSW